MYELTHTRKYIYIHIDTHGHTHIYTHLHTYTHINTCMCTHTRICIQIYMCQYVYIYICVCIYTCTYIYIYIYVCVCEYLYVCACVGIFGCKTACLSVYKSVKDSVWVCMLICKWAHARVRVSFGMILPVSTFPFSLCSTLQAIIASVPARQAMLAQKKATEAASKAAGYVYTHTSAHTHIISLTHTCSLVHMRMHMHMNIHMHMHMLAQHILAFCMPASAFSCSCVPHFVIAAVTNRVYSNFHVLTLSFPPPITHTQNIYAACSGDTETLRTTSEANNRATA